MSRSRKILAVLGALVVLALAGCVRFQADLRLNPDDTVNGSIVVAVVTEDTEESRDNAAASAQQIESALLPSLRGADGATANVYDQDDYLGTKFEFSNTPLSAFQGSESDGALNLTREGSEFAFSGVLDFSPEDGETEVDPESDTSDITVSVTFPGEVSQHNGELSGNTVTWSGTLESRIDMEARGSAVSSGPPAWVWAVVAGAVLLIAAAVVIVLVRRKRSASAPG